MDLPPPKFASSEAEIAAHAVACPAALSDLLWLTCCGTIAASAVWAVSPAKTLFALTLATLALRQVRLPSALTLDQRPHVSALSLLIGLTICLPSLLWLVNTASEEFPFTGDHDSQMGYARDATRFWSLRLLPLAAMVWLLLRQRKQSGKISLKSALLAALALALLGLWPWAEMTWAYRYPAVGQLLIFPIKSWSWWLQLPQPLLANRIGQWLSLPIWLFVLRPRLLGRWPDLAVLALGLLFYWQKDVVLYVTSPYLEPWALVLCLLAVEWLITRPKEQAWLAWLLIGLAALLKEQAILLLPFAVLAAGWELLRQPLAHARVLLAAALPFALYWAARTGSGVWRQAKPATWAEIWTDQRLQTFVNRVELQLGWLLPVLLLLVGLLLLHAWKRRSWLVPLLLTAALFQMLFFFSDQISLPWAGYPRFHLLPLALIGAGLLGLQHTSLRDRLTLSAVALLAATANTVTGWPAVAEATQRPQELRNFIEHSDSPLYFPVRSLLQQAADIGQPVGKLVLHHGIGHVAPGYSMHAILGAYPEFRFELREGDLSDCVCRDAQESVMLAAILFSHLGQTLPQRPVIEGETQHCLAQLHATCRTVNEHRIDGHLTGALGQGMR